MIQSESPWISGSEYDLWIREYILLGTSQCTSFTYNLVLGTHPIPFKLISWPCTYHLPGNHRSNALKFVDYALLALQTKFNGAATINLNTPLACDVHTETIRTSRW